MTFNSMGLRFSVTSLSEQTTADARPLGSYPNLFDASGRRVVSKSTPGKYRETKLSACFIVRAQVVDATVRDAFDRWYQDEHLPDAHKAFKARRAWRGWSEVDTNVHYAVYEFEDVTAARAIPDSDALEDLVAEFDRMWGDRVRRSRDVVDVIQTIGG